MDVWVEDGAEEGCAGGITLIKIAYQLHHFLHHLKNSQPRAAGAGGGLRVGAV